MHEPWWKEFFDEEYLRLWGAVTPADKSDLEATGIWELLCLRPGSKVLDAPCGYGRIAHRLAQKGARVVGVDQSTVLLARAELDRGELSQESLKYILHDLRQELDEGGFDAAINIFSSLGYGEEEEDFAILETLRKAVRSGGLVFVETNHRDAAVALLSRQPTPSMRLPDGTLVIEEPELDAVRGRIETCWYWSGPEGSGQKSASIRIYTASELRILTERAGLEFLSAHKGCSPEPFIASGPDMGGRIGLLSRRPK